jgi:DNA-binding response OmpR family regulator
VDLEWPPDGLRCRLAIPADQLVTSRSGAQPRHGDAERALEASPRSLDGRRILIVEDEALIAMQLENALAEAGCTVVGPAARLSEAFDLIYSSPIDAALLDVNVAGERSYALADILRSKNIPYAFVTGFEAGSMLPSHLKSAPVLPKPFENAQLEALLARL